MKKLIAFALSLALFNSLFAQQPSFSYWLRTIGSSGCYFYSPVENMLFDMSISDDGSDLWTANAQSGNTYYEIVCVRFMKKMEGNQDVLAMHMQTYLDYLQDQYHILSSRGYSIGHRMETNPQAIGITDHWEDDRGFSYHIKAWADKHWMAVMIVSAQSEEDLDLSQVFLNGFRFPER